MKNAGRWPAVLCRKADGGHGEDICAEEEFKRKLFILTPTLSSMLHIDGNVQEGGGQIVRTALALSAITGKPFRVTDIRKGRPVPGLKPQHLHCVKALQQLCMARTEGCEPGSTELVFYPGKLEPAHLSIDIGTAGSVTLLLQSLLLPAIHTQQPVTITLRGGTDVSWSQPIDYFSSVFAPLIRNVAVIKTELVKRGFYPKGGGLVNIHIQPNEIIDEFELESHDEILGIRGVSYATDHLQGLDVAERQKAAALKHLETVTGIDITLEYVSSPSPGSGIVLWAAYPKTRIGADCLGQKGKPAEQIGEEAALLLLEEINEGAVVDSRAADVLIPFLGVAKGAIKTSKITKHTLANIYVTEQFLGVTFKIEENVIRVKES